MIKIINGCLIEAFEEGYIDVMAHQVNCKGKLSSGIAKAIRNRYPEHYQDYLDFYNVADNLLGKSFFTIEDKTDRLIFGLFGQDNYGRGKRQTNYSALILALSSCVEDTKKFFFDVKPKIGLPYMIGCGLGGGDWSIVYTLLSDLQVMNPDVEIVLYKV